MYEGNAPCPGCGRTGQEKPRTSKDGLCYDCQHQLEIGRSVAKERGLECNYYRMDDLMTASLTYFTIPLKEIEIATTNFLYTLSQFRGEQVDWHNEPLAGKLDAITGRRYFVLPKVTFEAAQKMCQTIVDAANQLQDEKRNYREELNEELAAQKNEIFNEGVAYGRNLLTQLNRGEINVKDFEAVVKKY